MFDPILVTLCIVGLEWVVFLFVCRGFFLLCFVFVFVFLVVGFFVYWFGETVVFLICYLHKM